MSTEPAAPPHPADTVAQRAYDSGMVGDPRPRPVAVPSPSDIPTGPTWVSQATAIEQSRAIAEVAAMVQVARACPRLRDEAIAELEDVCGLWVVAEQAFYEYRRGGSNIHGPTIHLIVEVARCWGNVTHGLTELRRDVEGKYSECEAWAWDLQKNVRVAQRFIVPHFRDKGGKIEPLKELRDVYEKTANEGSRRVREAIKKVVPSWFVDLGETAAQATLDRGADLGKKAKPFDQRLRDAVARFDEIGVRVGQLEAKVERPRGEWTPRTLASLAVTFKSIDRGEIRVDEAFPAAQVTGDEIRAQHAELAAGGQPPREGEPPEPMPTPPVEYDADGNPLDPERPM